MSTQIQTSGITSHDKFTRLRWKGKGEYIDGYFEQNEGSDVERVDDISGSVQPPNRKGSHRIHQKYEGRRVEDWLVIFTAPGTLRITLEKEGMKSDRILYEGEIYECMFMNKWRGQVIRHDEVFIVRVDEGEQWDA